MSEHDLTADVLFHAAMSLGSGRKSVVRAAIADAVRYLCWTDDVKIWRPFHDAYRLYMLMNENDGDAWNRFIGSNGGSWLKPEDRVHQQLSVLIVYEYLVQELGAARSPMDLDYS